MWYLCEGREEGLRVKVARVLNLLNNLSLFLCKVRVVDGNLRSTTNGGVGQVLRGLASGEFLNMLINTKVATMVRSSSTAAIVIMNFMGSNVVALGRTI